MKEIWKDIEGFEGRYQVSNKGFVRNAKGHLMYQEANTSDYMRVRLSNPQKKFFVHRLVAKAFCKGYFEGAVVNHKDFNRHNNIYTNLEWVTASENQKHTYIAGRMTGAFKDVLKDYLLDGVYYKNTTVKHLMKSLGFCRNTGYNWLKSGKLLCVSNDYPEKE